MKKNYNKQNDLKDAFPVIRLGYDKKLMNCNLIALPLINQWNCKKGGKMPKRFFDENPEINYSFKDLNATECKIAFGDLQIWFDIVPFPEGGYVGLYGYHIESLIPEKPIQKLRLAS